MSWTFQLQKINQSFEKIAGWYYEFLQRTEYAFQALSQRVSHLEERQAWREPSDEQIERVLRKILAERFADDGPLQTDSVVKRNDFLVEDAKSRSSIRPITINAASLFVEPDSVPSKAYAETFQMLEGRLTEYPRTHHEESVEENAAEARIKVEYERSIL